MRTRLIVASLALAVPAALPAFASAATVSADGAGAVTLRDAANETNAIAVTRAGGNWVIDDLATTLAAGSGCTQATANEVTCAATAARNTAYLGGGDDTFVAPADGGWIAYGEAGADRLTGGTGADTLFGGPGADTIAAGDGNDRLDGGVGDDALDGGAGEDLLTYTAATAPVKVDLNAGTGGQPGEQDALTGIEDVTAGGTLTGDDGPNFLTGGTGDDVLAGNGGDDTLVGQAGNDTLDGGAGADRLYGDTLLDAGAGGNDKVNGGDGAGDLVNGGPGDDVVSGGSHLGAGDGADQIDGGDGTDTLDYSDRAARVDVDLSRTAPQGGPSENDSATAVELVAVGSGESHVACGTAVAGKESPSRCDSTIGPETGISAGRLPAPAPNAAVRPAGTAPLPAPRMTVRLLAKTLRLGRDGRLALRVNASSAGKLTIVFKHGTTTYLRKTVTLKKGTATLRLKLSAGSARTLRRHAQTTVKLSLGTTNANVVIKRG